MVPEIAVSHPTRANDPDGFLINLNAGSVPISESTCPNLEPVLAPTAKYYMLRPHLGLDVPIRAILENDYPSAVGPEDIATLTAAFEAALSKLELVDRKDPMTMTVAKLIIELAKNGERDPKKLCDDALKLLGK